MAGVTSRLLRQFIELECTDTERKLLFDALTTDVPPLQRFEFNRFELTIEHATLTVLIEDVLDRADTDRVSFEELAAALSPDPGDVSVRGSTFPCPCCAYLTLSEEPPGTFEVCPVCFWEDDAVQLEQPDLAGGANTVSLEEARHNFASFGASEARFVTFVRKPHPSERP